MQQLGVINHPLCLGSERSEEGLTLCGQAGETPRDGAVVLPVNAERHRWDGVSGAAALDLI